jgi:hypothetical protein
VRPFQQDKSTHTSVTRATFHGVLTRIGYLALPAYVIAVLVFRFAVGDTWGRSLYGIPLGILIGGIIVSVLFALFDQSRRPGDVR